MMVRGATLVAVALASAVITPAIAAYAQNLAETSPTQPVFLLSERDLGTGFKVCFLSNGLQMRLPVSQVCPYPLRAPPLAPEQPQLAAQPTSAVAKESAVPAEISKQVKLVESASMQTQSLQPSPSRPAVAAKPSQTQKPVEAPKPASPPVAFSQPIVQPVSVSAVAPENKSQSASTAPSPVTPTDTNDLIADKAIRRCERIGFKVGTEPFKSCALEQIRILSGVEPN